MRTHPIPTNASLAVALAAAMLACNVSRGGSQPLTTVGPGDAASLDLAPRTFDAATDATHPRIEDATVASDAGSADSNDADASDTGADAPVDVDNGAPSTVYPAPHPPLPELTNAVGGPILTSPTVHLVFYPGYPYVQDMSKFATNMAAASFWGEVTHEYGIGPLTIGAPITLAGETAPAMITSTEIEAWVAAELTSGAFGTPDPEGIYTLFYPATTTVTQPNPVLPSLAPVVSCVAFGGYHDNVSVALTDGGTPQNFAYAVIPTCDTNVNDLTAVLSHEWVEAATDPFLTSSGAFTLTGGPNSAYFTVDANHAVWALLTGGEAGDLCEPEGDGAYISPPDVGYTVQRTWSNLLAKASQDPCAPDPSGGVSFNSAPVLPEMVTFTSPFTGTLMTQGITIPAGQTKTIEVDLFSTGDTGGPWTVTAEDVLYTYYGSYGLLNTLAFSWDRTQGVNGDKLHLTITVTRESIVYGAHAFMITSTQGGRVAVWPGLIVE